MTLGGPTEPFFNRPLWLQTPCRGPVLWAYNARHVGAGLRERGAPTMSLLARLPAWIKQARHRAEVLRAIDRLRDRLGRPTARDRSATAR